MGIDTNIKVFKSFVQINKDELIKILVQFIILDLSKIIISYLMIDLNIIICPNFSYCRSMENVFWKSYIVHIKINDYEIGLSYNNRCGYDNKYMLGIFYSDCYNIIDSHIKYLITNNKLTKKSVSL